MLVFSSQNYVIAKVTVDFCNDIIDLQAICIQPYSKRFMITCKICETIKVEAGSVPG
jgi:hypothetical protein